MALSPELRALLETLVGLGYVEQVEIESDRDILFTRTVVAERVAAVHWYPPAGPGGGDAFWTDDGTNLRPVTGGRGINLGTGDIIADIATLNRVNIDAVGDLAVAGSQLRIEGPNGVEIVGLELQPIGTIFAQAGMLQWTGTAFQLYDGTTWITIAGVPPGGGGDGIGYWLDNPANNELHTLIPGRNVRIDLGSKLILNAARDAWLQANSTTLSIGMPNDGVRWFDWVNREIAHLTATGQLALYPAGAAPPILERLHVVGGIVVGVAASVAIGTIQYAGGHFQGRNATAWVNLDGTGLPPGDPGNPLVPTGVVPGVYGDAFNIPQFTVAVDGRLTLASNIPLTPSGIATVLGPVGGDLHGNWPALILNDIVPPIPAGTYGDATHLPTFTVDTKGRVTHAYHTAIRIARDPMARVHVYGGIPTDLSILVGPNGALLWNKFDSFFTPLATGSGTINGSLAGHFYNAGVDPGVGTPHTCWLSVTIWLDGVVVYYSQRGCQFWEPASGHGVTQPMSVAFDFPWAASVANSHELKMRVENFDSASNAVNPAYPCAFGVHAAEWTISEDAEPGIGTNSSYLMAGALVGPAAAGVIGSWVAAYAFVMPASLGGSWATLKVPAGAATSFNIQVNGVVKGQVNWAAGATVATFSFPVPVTINIGDRIELIGATGVSDPTWTLRGLL